MNGNIHSIESFGTVDGPGVRFVLFLQGCPLRCKYCHNPDSWDFIDKNIMTVDEILNKFNANKTFYKEGGITVTGGEPLMQIEFVTELFKKCKEQKIHTCIDTSGITFTEKTRYKFDDLMKYTDLILLDIKHIDPDEHIILTGLSNENVLNFLKYTKEKTKDVWLRHVLVPNITQNKMYLEKLGTFLGEFRNIKAIDVLPYHKMGDEKYKELGIENPLENTPEAIKNDAVIARNIIVKHLALRAREIKNND